MLIHVTHCFHRTMTNKFVFFYYVSKKAYAAITNSNNRNQGINSELDFSKQPPSLTEATLNLLFKQLLKAESHVLYLSTCEIS